MRNKLPEIVRFIKETYNTNELVPLHAPVFIGNEKEYLNKCIDSTFVSYIGQFVSDFETKIANYTGAKYAIATNSGTSALHIALIVANVGSGDEVIVPALTFVATANAVAYTGASPLFVDSDIRTLGVDVEKLEDYLEKNTIIKDDGFCYNKVSRKKIAACIPMHTFGHPLDIIKLVDICKRYNIKVIEDAAESLGSFYQNIHTGVFGDMGILSFNGNKIITSGGGGMILTNNEELSRKVKHLSTTAKLTHKWEFEHDEIGYNYRLTNICAAVGLAQLESLQLFLDSKRNLAKVYMEYFHSQSIDFFAERNGCKSNYWLNTLILKDIAERDEFLEYTNSNGVMTRPAWNLINRQRMYMNCYTTNLDGADYLSKRIVNIPSSVRL